MAAAVVAVIEFRNKSKTGTKKLSKEDADPFNLNKKSSGVQKESNNPFNLKSSHGSHRPYNSGTVMDEDKVTGLSKSCFYSYHSPPTSLRDSNR